LTAGRILGLFTISERVNAFGTILSGFNGGPRVTEFRKLVISTMED
jgi:hypothetical protein